MKKTTALVGTIAGAIAVLFGLIVLFHGQGSTVGNLAYGGDAYTGMQNASAATARNIYMLAGIAKYGLSGILLSGGVFLFGYYFPAFQEMNKAEKAGKVSISGGTVTVGTSTKPENENEAISKYKELLDQGVITEEDFSAKSRELMGLDAKTEE